MFVQAKNKLKQTRHLFLLPEKLAPHGLLHHRYFEFTKLLQSFPNYVKTFRNYNHTEIKEFEIAGQDFIFDLCAVVDVMAPIIALLLELQNLQSSVWKLWIWQKKVLDELKKFTTFSAGKIDSKMNNLFINSEVIKKMVFKATKLVRGWLIVGKTPSPDDEDEYYCELESQRNY